MNSPAAHHSDRWLSFELSHPRERLRILAATAAGRYRHMELKDKKGKLRPITDPSPELKYVQTAIREKLLRPIPLSPIVYSDVPGRSAVLNAKQHLNQPNVASVDIRRCYPSMTNAMVFRVFRGTAGLGDSLADLLTRLTTLNGHLPQGAPTSGALANLILSPVDVVLEDVASSLGLVVTRYVDNVDFSGPRAREAILPAIAVLQRFGFSVGRKKVFNAAHAAHIVTGQLVNGRTARLPRAKRANVRANADELVRQYQSGSPNSVKALNRFRGRLQHLRTQGHGRDAERLLKHVLAAGVVF